MRKKKPTTPLLPPIEVPMLEPRIEGDVDGAYGGVGLRHVEDLRGLVLYVINPKVGVGGGSVLSLFWGNTNVPVASTPIREEDKNEDRFALTVPLHFIVEDWANPVFARLRPTGGNPIETERIKLRVSLRRPGGLDPDDATPHHQGLVKVVPAQVLLNGVDETTAQAGVKILIRHYEHMRPYDLIILAWGSEEVVHRVQPDEVGKDITLTVDYATISAADNNPLTRVFFWVRDAGGNRPEERARHSAVALIDVHLNQTRPDAPWLEFPGTHTNIIDLLELGGWDAEIKIWVTAAQAAAYSIVTLIWAGTDSEDNSIPHTETKPLTRPGDYSFNIPNSVVVAIAQGSAYVHALFQGSAGELPSQKLSLEIVGESIRWPAPTIDEDLGGHIDRDVNATVRFKLQAVWPANGYIEVIFLVSSADGTIEHRIGRQVDDVPPTPDGDLTFTIYPAELIRFDGRLVDVFYAHTRPEPGSRPQESLRLQIIVGQLQRTLPAPLVDKVVGGQLNPDDIEAYATARSTYSDTKRLDKIRMFWNGPQASTDKVVDVIVDGGTTEHHFDKPYVDENLGESVSVFYSLTRGSELPRYSLITEVLISRALGDLPAPTLLGASVTGPGTAVLQPINVVLGTQLVVSYIGMRDDDSIKIRMLGTGNGGSPDIPPKNGNEALQQVRFDISKVAIAANVRDVDTLVRFDYVVTRAGESIPSAILTVTFKPIPDTELAKTVIRLNQAKGKLLDLNDFTGNATAHIGTWPFITEGYPVWLLLLGKTSNNVDHEHLLLNGAGGAAVTREWASSGSFEWPVPRTYLDGLGHNTKLFMVFKAALSTSRVEVEATTFPTIEYTVNTVQLPINFPVPILRQATGSGNSVTLAPLNAQSGGTVSVEFLPMYATDNIRVTMVGTSGAGSPAIPAKAGSTAGVVTFDIPATAIGANIGNGNKTFTLKYDVTRDGQTRPSLLLTVTVTPIPAAALANTVIRIIEADTNTKVLDLEKVTAGATSRVGVWPFIRLGQPVWLRLTGYNSGNAAIPPIQVWNGAAGSEVNQGWLDARFLDARIAYNSLKDLGHGKTLTMEFKASLSGSRVEADAIVFPSIVYQIENIPGLNDYSTFENGNWNGWTARVAGPDWAINQLEGGNWFAIHRATQLWPNKTGPMLGKVFSVASGRKYIVTTYIYAPYGSARTAKIYVSANEQQSLDVTLVPGQPQTVEYTFTANSNSVDVILNTRLGGYDERLVLVRDIRVRRE
jgi:hypothetical protein